MGAGRLLRKQMVRDGVQTVKKFRVNVWVVFVLLASRVVLDVEELVVEVLGVSDAMVVVSGVPDLYALLIDL